jgi:hypothetical protein
MHRFLPDHLGKLSIAKRFGLNQPNVTRISSKDRERRRKKDNQQEEELVPRNLDATLDHFYSSSFCSASTQHYSSDYDDLTRISQYRPTEFVETDRVKIAE